MPETPDLDTCMDILDALVLGDNPDVLREHAAFINGLFPPDQPYAWKAYLPQEDTPSEP